MHLCYGCTIRPGSPGSLYQSGSIVRRPSRLFHPSSSNGAGCQLVPAVICVHDLPIETTMNVRHHEIQQYVLNMRDNLQSPDRLAPFHM